MYSVDSAICVCVCVCVCARARVCVCVCVYIYIYIYIYFTACLVSGCRNQRIHDQQVMKEINKLSSHRAI